MKGVYVIVDYSDDHQLLMETTGPAMAVGMLDDILAGGVEEAPLQLLDRTVESVTFTTKRPDVLTVPEGEDNYGDDVPDARPQV